jgi:hypothetical protein
VGVPGEAPRGGANGAERGGGPGSATWTGTAWTRRIRATPIVVCGACLAGMARTGEGGGAYVTRARPTDRRDRAVAGSGRQRRGAGETGESGQRGGSR